MELGLVIVITLVILDQIGYSGSACNIKDQGCSTSPCLNGATCTDLGGLNYTCKCPVEYDGINCQNRKQSTYKGDYFTEIT